MSSKHSSALAILKKWQLPVHFLSILSCKLPYEYNEH
jgi:hypothetical protein